MKKLISIIILTLIISCSSEKKNPTGLNPENMTEEELYMHYGLEAPQEVYEFVFTELKNNQDFKLICKEKTTSNFIAVEINIENETITETRTKFSDYSKKLDTQLIKAFKSKKVDFKFTENRDGLFDFRLDIEKLCQGKDFSTTPPKDSTLEIMPILNKSLEETKDFVNDSEKVNEYIEEKK